MKKFAAILAAIMILAMLCGTIVPVSATEAAEEIDSSLYDAVAWGELIYTLNFAGDDIWQPKTWIGEEEAEVTPDAADPTKCVFKAMGGAKTHWGAPIVGLPIAGAADDGSEDLYAYTIEFKTTRDQLDEAGNCIDAPFGLYFDDCYDDAMGNGVFPGEYGTADLSAAGVYGYSYKFDTMEGSERIGKSQFYYIENGLSLQGVNYNAEGADPTVPSVQEYALEINAYEDTWKLYAKDSTGEWAFIEATEVGDVLTFAGTYLFPTLYAWGGNGEKPITVDYVKIYKGMTISGDELPGAEPADTTTVPADTTTVPADTTTVPADTTTVPADTTTAPTGNDNTTTAPQGNTTTKAPESNGCGGFAVLPVSIVAILGLAVTVVAKKAI